MNPYEITLTLDTTRIDDVLARMQAQIDAAKGEDVESGPMAVAAVGALALTAAASPRRVSRRAFFSFGQLRDKEPDGKS